MRNNSIFFTSTFAPNPFGSPMDGSAFSSDKYRFGFNGKEKDNEVKGAGSQQDYGMRIYDPRLGRFISVDPISKGFPMLTPYQFASNRPIDGIDLDGLEFSKTTTYNKETGTTYIHITVKVKVKDWQGWLSNEEIAGYLAKAQESFNSVMNVYDNQMNVQFSGSLIFDNSATIGLGISEPKPNDASAGMAMPGFSTCDIGDIKYDEEGRCDDYSIFSPEEFALIVAEEVLHQGGLDHPIDQANNASDVCLKRVGRSSWETTSSTNKSLIFKNLLLYDCVSVDGINVKDQRDGNQKRSLSPDQMNELNSNIDNGKVNGEAMYDDN